MIAEAIGIITTGGGGVWAAWVKVLRPYMKSQKKKSDERDAKIDKIANELIYGNGTTLKQVIFKIDDKISKVETRLDGLEENQRLSMNLQGIAYWVSGDSGECIYASPALCKLFSRPESQILGNNWMAWLHPEDKDHLVDAWKFSTENQSAFDEIYRIKKSDGKYIKVWGVAFPKAKKNNFGGTLGKLTAIEEPK